MGVKVRTEPEKKLTTHIMTFSVVEARLSALANLTLLFPPKPTLASL